MTLDQIADECHRISHEHGFWEDNDKIFNGDRRDPLWILSRLALIHSEVSEALEAVRVDDMDNFEDELIDVLIRVFDLWGGTYGMGNLDDVLERKMRKNEQRPFKHGKNS